MADHPGLDDDATVGGEQTAAGERGAASPERRAAARGPPLLAVVESGPTPACFLARRTSLMKLSRRPRLPMRPIRILNSLVAAHGGKILRTNLTIIIELDSQLDSFASDSKMEVSVRSTLVEL
jgi:hypothetical protein